MKTTTKKLTVLAMLGALAYVVMFFGRIPVVLFLKYDPKDIVITIGGFLYGPLAALAVTVAVSFVEMFTASTTGLIGLLMNIVSGAAFACTAALIYQKNRSLKGAVIGLVAAWLLTTAVMVMWNYLITPIFMFTPEMAERGMSVADLRQQVVKMLLPAFVPFNLLKGGLNAAITMLLYKPVKSALQAARMMPSSEEQGKPGKFNLGVIIASVFVIATCVLWWLVLQGKL